MAERTAGGDLGPVRLDAWEHEPALREERSRWHPDAPPWHSWNGMSPEHEFCAFVAALVAMAKPRLVIETGVGQGFTTRRIAAELAPGATFKGFESDEGWRRRLRSLPFFDRDRIRIAEAPTPSDEDLAAVDLLVADSAREFRRDEVSRWASLAKGGALIVVHDTGNGHPEWTPHHRMGELVESLGIEYVSLPNPRGCVVGQR